MKKKKEMKKEKKTGALMFVTRRDWLAGRCGLGRSSSVRPELVCRKLLEKLPRVKAVK